GDEPAFTQPIMYRKIAQHPSSRQIYARRLAEEGSIPEAQSEAMVKEYHDHLQQEFDAAKSYKPNKADWLEGRWTGFTAAHGEIRRGRTDVGKNALATVGKALTQVPEDFNLHRTVRRLLKTKRENLESGSGIDWSTGEALAFGNLLMEGVPVRLSGQDSGRGTFSQRHAVLTDQTNEQKYVPLNHIAPRQAKFEVIDSMLSEAAVLGFEYGYTLAEPQALVLWEAQFGDFANGAQVIIDQFLASGETKWLRMSGLVMLLPHGQEGQGPEHSSARLERYLQICAEDNMQVANCTTPASYFHILRRQIHRDFRKPLILMTPKSLLRHRQAVSPLSDFGLGSSFHRVLWDGSPDLKADAKIRRVVLCSGKVYYDLFAEREARGIDNVYIFRLEQLYPFPDKALTEELARFPKASVVWCQEEPQNMGAWNFVDRRIEAVLAGIKHAAGRPIYAGRPEMSAPAPGTIKLHNQQQQSLVDAALVI
ncbi:MAG: 2-oxoglutarate dehydrogenase E1 component, partial [Alphaproteobacteria bacterium]|nr:2-oxoglutarate dehydrogenase E1 component [Alphaproteobacteria bacterium]